MARVSATAIAAAIQNDGGRLAEQGVQSLCMAPDARLRVLHATPSFAPAYRYGGPVRSVEGLVVELHRRGVAVRVLTTDAHGDDRLRVGSLWQTWRDVPVRYLPRWAPPDLAPAFVW